jgi:VWFA-related protein
MRSLLRTFIAGCLTAAVAFAARGDAQSPAQGQSQPGQPDQQAAPEPSQTPTFRAGINFVRVDVIVSDRSGNAVADLKQSDFEVVEDGKPQSIETFKLINLEGGSAPTPEGPPRQIRNDADEESEAARDDVRLFGIFLDDYHVRVGASVTVRDPLTRFIETQLGPSDMVGVMHPLTPLDSIRMTRNRSSITGAIQQFRGRKGNYTPENEFEQRYMYYPAETVERIRNEVSLSALKALIVHMGGLKEGRKALILVSEGYSNVLPPQLRDQVAGVPGSGNPNQGNPTAGLNDPNEQRYAFFASQDLEFYMQGVWEAASQNNVAIYTVDPRGLAAFEFDVDQGVGIETDRQFLAATTNTLRDMAVQTDGRAILNRNDLDIGMKQILHDSSAYYLLGYNSNLTKSDGKFHAITVRVKRPGVQVRYRKGYWALTAENVAAVTAAKKPGAPPDVAAALATVNQPARARLVRTWIGTSRGENGKTKVTFVWEPAPKLPGERQPANSEQPSRVSLMALGADGSAYFRGRVPDVAVASLSPASGTAANGSATARGPSRVTFEARPGKMQLRVSVEGAASQVLDSEIREIAVPDLTSAGVVLGTPEVFRARTIRDYQQLKADPDAVPAATREFSRTERLFIRISAYGPAGSTPPVKARLLNRDGAAMTDLSVPALTAGADTAQIDVPVSGLAPGEYLVEITAGDARELVAFRLTA